MKTSFITAVWMIVRKDLQAELRSRELLSAMGLFSLLSVLIFSFALQLDQGAREEVISGVLWVTIVFSSILGLNRSLAMEREQGNLDAMLLAPVDRTAIYFGKLVGNFLFTLIVGVILLPLMTILYNVNMIQPWLILVLLGGILGFSTVGTLLATMTVQSRTRETLLPIVMLPIVLPLLLASVNGSIGILSNAPMADWITWPQILLVVNLIYIALCFLLFDFLVED